MKNKKLIIMIMAIYLMGLSSCSNQITPVTEDKVKEDIRTAFGVNDNDIKLNDLSLESVTVDGDVSTAKATITIEKPTAISILDVTVSYTVSKNKWVYDKLQYDFVSAITKQEPDPQLAKVIITEMEQKKEGLYSFFDPDKYMTVIDTVADRNNGNVIFTFQADYEKLHTQVTGTVQVKGTYRYDTGWTFAVEDWTYVEMRQYYGQFFMTFPDVLPNPDSWFSAKEKAIVELYGDITLTIKKDQDPAFTHTLEGTLVKSKVRIAVIPSPILESESAGQALTTAAFKITFNEAEDGYVLLRKIEVDNETGATPSVWTGIDGDGNPFEALYQTDFGVSN